jgi:hypothetical protein
MRDLTQSLSKLNSNIKHHRKRQNKKQRTGEHKSDYQGLSAKMQNQNKED